MQSGTIPAPGSFLCLTLQMVTLSLQSPQAHFGKKMETFSLQKLIVQNKKKKICEYWRLKVHPESQSGPHLIIL